MVPISIRRYLGCFFGVFVACTAAIVAACSGGSSSNGSSSGPGNDAGDAGVSSSQQGAPIPTDAGAISTQAGTCANPTVPIIFAPMYSAFIPGDTAVTFAIPAITGDGNTATWSLSDPTQGNLQLEAFENSGATIPGVLITVAGTGNDGGQVTVIATESNGACGESVLTITQNTASDWSIGNARYNDGVALHVGRPEEGDGGTRDTEDGGFDGGEGGTPHMHFDGGMVREDGGGPVLAADDAGSYYETDGGTACTNCHGPTATSGPYKTVSHTPEQTGGFSDMDLQNIIWNGEVPDGGYFDPTVLIPSCDGGATCTAQAKALWHSFHRWTDITSDELPGVICYLRALTPEAQNGTSNFGGYHGRRDGGQ
jgi:hypothetical protein